MIRMLLVSCAASVLSGCLGHPAETSNISPQASIAFQTCSEAIAASSRRHGAAVVHVSPNGTETLTPAGGTEVPLTVRIEYARDRHERLADVQCELDLVGKVIAIH